MSINKKGNPAFARLPARRRHNQAIEYLISKSG